MAFVTYEATPILPALVCEPTRSFPFLTDGEKLYLVEDWRAVVAHPGQLRARRLSKSEQRMVLEALSDAAEEAAYRLRPSLSARGRRGRLARS